MYYVMKSAYQELHAVYVLGVFDYVTISDGSNWIIFSLQRK